MIHLVWMLLHLPVMGKILLERGVCWRPQRFLVRLSRKQSHRLRRPLIHLSLSWTDPFRKFTQLQSCVRLSITEFRGEIRASLVPKQFSPPHRQQGGGRQPGGGPPQPGFAAKDFSKIPGFDPEIQTVKNDAGGKGICKQYQVGKCAFGAKCRWAHVCDVMMEGNQACGASHTRQGHFAATGNKGKGRGSGPPPPPAEQETG